MSPSRARPLYPLSILPPSEPRSVTTVRFRLLPEFAVRAAISRPFVTARAMSARLIRAATAKGPSSDTTHSGEGRMSERATCDSKFDLDIIVVWRGMACGGRTRRTASRVTRYLVKREGTAGTDQGFIDLGVHTLMCLVDENAYKTARANNKDVTAGRHTSD